MRRWSALALLAVLPLCACGGSSSAASSSPTSSAASSTVPSSAVLSSSSAASGPLPSSSARARDTHVRLPARFIIRSGDVLSPPQIAAPKRVTVALTVISGDGKPHRFVLQTPHRHQVSVSSGRSAMLTLKGLASGTYSVQVDGSIRGRLIIGVTPGP